MGGRWLQADVAALVPHAAGWSVATTDGRSLACRNLLITAGIGTAPILERLGIPTDISPEYGPVLAVRPDTPTHIPSIMRVNTFGFVPQDDGQIWVTGIRAPHVGLDTPRWAIGELVSMVQALLGTRITVTHIWEGYRPRRPKTPAIGPIAGMPHHWVAAGHGGNGMLLAPVTAQIIREYLTAAA
jgi:glycine/D-amino acid oxidase-like deaminating enzyme